MFILVQMHHTTTTAMVPFGSSHLQITSYFVLTYDCKGKSTLFILEFCYIRETQLMRLETGSIGPTAATN